MLIVVMATTEITAIVFMVMSNNLTVQLSSLTLLTRSRNLFLLLFGNASEIYVLPDEHDHTQHGSARIDSLENVDMSMFDLECGMSGSGHTCTQYPSCLFKYMLLQHWFSNTCLGDPNILCTA